MTRTTLPGLMILALLALPGPQARATEVTGTSFSIIYRGPALAPTDARAGTGRAAPNTVYNPYRPQLRIEATPSAQVPVGAIGVLRLADARTGAEIARASFDQRLDGWLFQLPMKPALAAGGGCLSLRSAAGGMLPVRDAGGADDGLSFANPLWAAELGRLGEQVELKREREQLDARQNQARAELKQLQDTLPPGGPGACVTPPQPPDPPRPAAALDEGSVRAGAGAICAARWQKIYAPIVDLGRLFQDAGIGADWSARESGRDAAAALEKELKLRATVEELMLVIDAAKKGKVFLEHASGVQILLRAQAACRTDVPALAAAATRDWDAEVQKARQAPARLLRECQLGAQRVAQLQQQIGAGEGYRAELERRAGSQAGGPPSAQSMTLTQSRCQ